MHTQSDWQTNYLIIYLIITVLQQQYDLFFIVRSFDNMVIIETDNNNKYDDFEKFLINITITCYTNI